MVAITPGCGFVSNLSSMLVGFIAALVVYFVGKAIQTSDGLEYDVLEVGIVHGLSGLIGVILTAVFCSKEVNPYGKNGVIFGNFETLGVHLLALLCTIPYIAVGTIGCLFVSDLIIPFRASKEEEDLGLDRVYWGRDDGDENSRKKTEELIEEQITESSNLLPNTTGDLSADGEK